MGRSSRSTSLPFMMGLISNYPLPSRSSLEKTAAASQRYWRPWLKSAASILKVETATIFAKSGRMRIIHDLVKR